MPQKIDNFAAVARRGDSAVMFTASCETIYQITRYIRTGALRRQVAERVSTPVTFRRWTDADADEPMAPGRAGG